MRRCFRLMIVIIMLFFIGFTTAGCGGGGDDDRGSEATSGKWDEVVWDVDVWGG